MKRTKIVCTIGPASRDAGTLGRLVDAGMNVCRLNFSHGTHAEHAATIETIRAVAESKGAPIAILQDLAGPKIRTGPMGAGEVELTAGAAFTLTARDVPGDVAEVGLTYPGLPAIMQAGDTLLLADGDMALEVESADATDIRCRVVTGGRLGSNKGINLPDRTIDAPILSPKDEADLDFGIEQGVDYVALSFVRSAEDVRRVKARIDAAAGAAPLIAKIEKFEALDDIDAIVAAADGIMVARGDLGVEIPLERVPREQKRIIAKANAAAKPVITATQMLKSMVENPRPTRAEVTDVANAILDGTDAIMLSEETAMGAHPVEAVRVMSRVAAETEAQFDYDGWTQRLRGIATLDFAGAVAHNAVEMANDIAAAAILTCTSTGSTTRAVARFRPRQILLAITPNPWTARRLALVFGALPIITGEINSAEELEREAIGRALAAGHIAAGQPVVITAGLPFGVAGSTNMIKIVVV